MMLSSQDRLLISGIVLGSFRKVAEDKAHTDYSLKGWQQLVPTLVGGGLGATYGAIKAPGGSPTRGAIVGGLAGAGAGAAGTAAHQALASPYGTLMRDSNPVNAALILGGGAVGGIGGLHAGRQFADKLHLPDKNKNDELDELDLLRERSPTLPKFMSKYFKM